MSGELTDSTQFTASSRAVSAYVVEIGAIGNIGVQLDTPYGLLLNLLPNAPSDAERQPLKQRNMRRGRKARA